MDIDLAILCPLATDHNWHQIMEALEDADTLLPIDYVRFDHIADNDPLKSNILRNKKILYHSQMILRI